MAYVNTGEVCFVYDGEKVVDIGNFFTDEGGKKCLITSREFAVRYGHLFECDVYILREKKAEES